MTEVNQLTTNELLKLIEAEWNQLTGSIATLTEEQLMQPTDTAGWRVQDHLIHLAVWDEHLIVTLDGGNRREHLKIDRETWKSNDFDQWNAVIYANHRDLSLAEVRERFHVTHAQLVARLEMLSDEDLYRPYKHYQPHSSSEHPILPWITGTTNEHYPDHHRWIVAIVEGGEAQKA